MPDELVCPIHGPYPANLGSCPYCSGSGGRPPTPEPLEDDLPTDLGAAGGVGYGREDDQPTDLGYRGHRSPGWEGDDMTNISSGRKGQGQINYDEEEETELARARRDDVTELEYAPTGTLGILWVKDGSRRGQIYHIKNGTVVGRREGSLMLDDPKVSNPHAKFTVENDDKFIVWDFGSSNGTFVNGERIRSATELNENDDIRMGNMIFVLKVLPEP